MKRLLLVLLFLPLFAHAQIITTIAGTGGVDCSGDGNAAIDATFAGLNGICVDSSGNIYVVDYACNAVRKIDKFGIISLYAGNGSNVYSGDNDSATLAGLHQPLGIALDHKGNLYIADDLDNRIRKVSTSGIITTIAGTGVAGYNGDNIPATSAQINEPFDITVDKIGNVYIGDFGDARVRKVDTNGIISTIAGNGHPYHTPDGSPGTHVGLGPIVGLAVDDTGNVYISCSNDQNIFGGIDNCIRKLTTSGQIITVAGNDTSGYRGDGQPATSALLYFPYKTAINKNGELFVADMGNNRIRKIDTAGIITTIAGTGVNGFSGDGLNADSAMFNEPKGLAFDLCSNLLVADFGNGRVRKIGFNPYCWPEQINNIIVTNTISIYPNPATTSLTIQSTNNPITQITITNLLGQTIYTETNTTNIKQAQIDISQLSPGIYLIKINGTEVRKFVKE